MTTQEEQIYRLATSLLINTLSESLLRTLTPVQSDDKVRTTNGVVILPPGTLFTDANNVRWKRVSAGILNTETGHLNPPYAAALPVTVIPVPVPEPEDPAVLRTEQELSELPTGTVVQSNKKGVFLKRKDGNWNAVNSTVRWESYEITLPARVLS